MDEQPRVLKLYHVEITEEIKYLQYDTYSAFVAAVYSEDEARRFHPGTGETVEGWLEGKLYRSGYRPDWVKEEDIPKLKVKFLGVADKDVNYGMICSDFHAG